MKILGYDLRFTPRMLLGTVGLLSLQKVLTPPPFLFESFSLFDYNAYFSTLRAKNTTRPNYGLLDGYMAPYELPKTPRSLVPLGGEGWESHPPVSSWTKKTG